jgi:PHP family Zn ribbon phosphoesterase
VSPVLIATEGGFVKMTEARRRYLQGQAQAADPQPWRCAACGVAVRKGYNDPCKCFPQAGGK